MLDPVIHMLIACGVALLFFDAAFHKLRDLAYFRATLADYRLLPIWALSMAAVTIPVVEIAIAIVALMPSTRVLGLISAAGLLVLYAIAMGVNLARGRSFIDCGCHGPAVGGEPGQRISRALVFRNVLIAAIALAGTTPSFSRHLYWVDYVTCAAALLFFALLYAAANRMISEAPRLKELKL